MNCKRMSFQLGMQKVRRKAEVSEKEFPARFTPNYRAKEPCPERLSAGGGGGVDLCWDRKASRLVKVAKNLHELCSWSMPMA